MKMTTCISVKSGDSVAAENPKKKSTVVMIEKERRNELSCEMLILKSNYKLPEVYGNRMIEEQVECQRFDE